MGYFAPGETFENMLQLKIGLYFEIVLNSKWLCFHIKIIISATNMLWGSEACSPKKFEMIGAIWSVLMYYFNQI